MAKDLTDVLRDQLQQAVREFAENLADGSEKQRPSRRFSGIKGAVVGAGLALAAKKGIDAVRQNPGLLDGVSSRISAKLEELQGREEEPEEAEEEPDNVEEEPALESEGGSDEEPKPRSTRSRRTAKPKAGTRAKKPVSASTRHSSNSS